MQQIAGQVEGYLPLAQLLARVCTYVTLDDQRKSLAKRRKTLVAIEERTRQLLHPSAASRVGGTIQTLGDAQRAVVRDAQRRARNAMVWLDFVQEMYRVVKNDEFASMVHEGSMELIGGAEARGSDGGGGVDGGVGGGGDDCAGGEASSVSAAGEGSTLGRHELGAEPR